MSCMERVGLHEYSVFGVPGRSSSVDMAYEEEVVCVLEAEHIMVGAGAVELDGGREKRTGLFIEVLR